MEKICVGSSTSVSSAAQTVGRTDLNLVKDVHYGINICELQNVNLVVSEF